VASASGSGGDPSGFIKLRVKLTTDMLLSEKDITKSGELLPPIANVSDDGGGPTGPETSILTFDKTLAVGSKMILPVNVSVPCVNVAVIGPIKSYVIGVAFAVVGKPWHMTAAATMVLAKNFCMSPSNCGR
jgi:hypothetical protein